VNPPNPCLINNPGYRLALEEIERNLTKKEHCIRVTECEQLIFFNDEPSNYEQERPVSNYSPFQETFLESLAAMDKMAHIAKSNPNILFSEFCSFQDSILRLMSDLISLYVIMLPDIESMHLSKEYDAASSFKILASKAGCYRPFKNLVTKFQRIDNSNPPQLPDFFQMWDDSPGSCAARDNANTSKIMRIFLRLTRMIYSDNYLSIEVPNGSNNGIQELRFERFCTCQVRLRAFTSRGAREDYIKSLLAMKEFLNNKITYQSTSDCSSSVDFEFPDKEFKLAGLIPELIQDPAELPVDEPKTETFE